MAKEFLLPDPGEGIHEADILDVHVSPGDEVKDGDPLFSVETDKAVVDIPASFDGAIQEVRVEVGDVVEVGSVLLTFTESGKSTSTPPEGEETPDEEDGIGKDAQQEKDEREEAEEEPTDGDEEKPSREPSRRPVPASPATRSLAKKLGVDLHEMEGSGPDGRIEPSDVQAAAGEEEEAEERAEPFEEAVEWVELRGVRRATARQMAKSWREIPHVTHHDVADVTELEGLRRQHASDIEEDGGRLSITAFLVKAVAAALSEHPRFNATIDAENERIALKREINIGIAVDTEDGLVVPVIDGAADKSIAEIAMELPELASRMRSRDRDIADLRGGTFTITNPGGIGGTFFTPIINHPEVAILGAARVREVPVIADGGSQDEESPKLEPRLHLPLVIAFDHRVNDGADAARFMNTIKMLLEDPGQLLLHI